MQLGLRGKVAVVTGASRGIGKGCGAGAAGGGLQGCNLQSQCRAA